MEDETINSAGQEILETKKKSNILLWVIVFLLIIIIGGATWFLMGKSKSENSTVDKSNNAFDDESTTKKGTDQNRYNWSTMDKGPYHDRVSFATGKSLTSWTSSKKIIAEHASVPEIIIKEGVIYVYFVDVTEDGVKEQIGMVKSSDNGITWSDRQIIKIDGLGDKAAVDPDPFLLEDGSIRLYYFDISKTMTSGLENNSIYSAISTDGINFTEEKGVRFKHRAIFDPDVIRVGNNWRMYVGTDDQKVLSATSSDGLTFEYEGVALTDGSIPNVIYEDNTYYLFTGGIEISTSKDGKTFTKTSNRFDSGGLTADAGVAKISDGNYILVFKTDDGSTKASTPSVPNDANNPVNPAP